LFKSEASFQNAKFIKKSNFEESSFIDEVIFLKTMFKSGVDFIRTNFLNRAYFSPLFQGETYFRDVRFENPNKIIFEAKDMSKVSFLYTDITKIRFGNDIDWGGDDHYTIFEEKLFAKSQHKSVRDEDEEIQDKISLEDVLSVYRSLRENYEFRLRYGEAGKFFIKEMDLKRKYRKGLSYSDVLKRKLIRLGKKFKLVDVNMQEPKISDIWEHNGFWRKNFSLIGLYYHFSTYGESVVKPTIIGAIIVGLSTIFWLVHNDPAAEPSISIIRNTGPHFTDSSNFINITHILVWNSTHLQKAFERSLSDLLPLLSSPSNIKIGIIDFIVKIVGGALTFVLLGIALRRKFERKYTR
jgi:hypothetical protein